MSKKLIKEFEWQLVDPELCSNIYADLVNQITKDRFATVAISNLRYYWYGQLQRSTTTFSSPEDAMDDCETKLGVK